MVVDILSSIKCFTICRIWFTEKTIKRKKSLAKSMQNSEDYSTRLSNKVLIDASYSIWKRLIEQENIFMQTFHVQIRGFIKSTKHRPTNQPTQYSPTHLTMFYLKGLIIERYRFYRTQTPLGKCKTVLQSIISTVFDEQHLPLWISTTAKDKYFSINNVRRSWLCLFFRF